MNPWLPTLLLALLLNGAAPATPGTSRPSPAVVGSSDGPAGISAGYEVRVDRFDYRFENPSNFDTSYLVPHFFEQTYRADHQWLVVRARYRVANRMWVTEVGFAPEQEGHGSDADTFSNPDGNVIVDATETPVALLSWRVRHRVALARVGGFDTSVGYSYRRDRSVFPDSTTTITQTKPPSFVSFWDTGRERTISEVHQIRLAAHRQVPLSARWTLRVGLDVSPIDLARLTTLLPDKYPDRPIIFTAKGTMIEPRVDLNGRLGRWSINVAADYTHHWSYKQDSQFGWNGAGLSVSVGR
ncbi:MAG TPA: hypothetical protein VGK32_23115 [Vicinamibacterales bacterium]